METDYKQDFAAVIVSQEIINILVLYYCVLYMAHFCRSPRHERSCFPCVFSFHMDDQNAIQIDCTKSDADMGHSNKHSTFILDRDQTPQFFLISTKIVNCK